MVDNEIRTAKCRQCCVYFRDDSVDIRLALADIVEVDIGIFGIYLRQLRRDDIEPGFAVIGIEPAMGVNVYSGVLILVMSVFVMFVPVTVGFKSCTVTEGKHCGTLCIHEFNDLSVSSQCI